MSLLRVLSACLFALLAGAACAQPLQPDIVVTKVIAAPVADVWHAWTTPEGIESFFARKAAKVDARPGGAFELWFALDAPEGSRGSEGCHFHSVTPMQQLVFEWNSPPTLPVVRPLHTLVYLDFRPVAPDRTEVTLRNFGYGQGEDWQKSKAYFERAWNSVMDSLQKRFAQ
jgi:uncharacterized protein YndB with AHSA1/START domain